MSQVVRRSAAILRVLQGHPNGLSVGDVASAVDLPRSTVHRLLKSLEAEHLVAGSSEPGGFRLGPALIHLSTSASAWLVDATHRHLVELSAEVRETVDLAVLSGTQVHFVDQVMGPQRLQAASAVGRSFPAHCTANGKALLATMTDDQVTTLLAGQLDQLTPNTIVDMQALLDELAGVREAGIAFDREEHSIGVSAVGTRVENPYGLKVALSIPAPTTRFIDREAELTEAIARGRQVIEEQLAPSASGGHLDAPADR